MLPLKSGTPAEVAQGRSRHVVVLWLPTVSSSPTSLKVGMAHSTIYSVKCSCAPGQNCLGSGVVKTCQPPWSTHGWIVLASDLAPMVERAGDSHDNNIAWSWPLSHKMERPQCPHPPQESSLKAWKPSLLLSECPHFMASPEKDGSGCRDSFPSARGSFISTHVV